VARGETITGDPDKYLNLIHIDDAAMAVLAAFDRGEPGQVYLVADDRPVTRREYYTRVAESLGVGAPRFEPASPGSAEADRDATNKQVTNRRMRTELGVTLAYPDITTGLPQALAGE
jgi:nucleoside-diphosphate-sugar epimerase